MSEAGGRGSRQAWQRWLRAEEQTGPMPIVDRLRGTPFRDPRRMQEPAESEAQQALDFGLRLGELLFRSGAGTRDVEASLIAVTAALGLTHVEVDITVQSMMLAHAPPDRPPLMMVRVARAQSRDHARLVATHRLVADLVAGRCARADAEQRLAEVERSRRPWPRWVVSIAYGALAAAVCVLVGGGLLGATFALVVSIALDLLGRVLRRRGLAAFFVTFVGAAVVSVLTVLAVRQGLLAVAQASAVVAGGIVVLLPGRLLVAAVEDAISGFTVTASGRLLDVLLTGAAIIAGVAVGLGVADRLGIVIRVDRVPASVGYLTRGLGAAAVASLATAAAYRTSRALVLPATVTGVLGFFVFGVLRVSGVVGPIAATAVAAVVIGLLARVLAGQLRAPALVLAVPALSTLLPGLTIFRGMSQLTEHAQAGVGTLFTAMATALAIGAGVTFGDVLASPADRLRPRGGRRLTSRR